MGWLTKPDASGRSNLLPISDEGMKVCGATPRNLNFRFPYKSEETSVDLSNNGVYDPSKWQEPSFS